MTDGPPTLRDALESVAGAATAARLRPRVERLIARYRAGGSATSPILRDDLDALAYALYRAPATYAATRAALCQAAAAGLAEVRRVVDLGGGSGAAAWAARAVWPEATARVGDQVEPLLDLGRRLSPGSGIDFFRWRLGEPVPSAGLVTVAYVLSELTGAQRRQLVEVARAAAERAVLVIEPGTPDGYRRVLAVRQQLLDAGWRLIAPCPHQRACPLAHGDWCHFAARVDRSVIHRRLKDGSLGYEDEKFSFCVAVPPASPAGAGEPGSRVIRHPVKRKGVVELTLCRPDGTAGRQLVSKRRGADYRSARDLRWGDTWAPATDLTGD